METSDPKPKRSWFARHKIVALAVLVLAGAAGYAEYQQYKIDHAPQKTTVPDSETKSSSGAAEKAKMTLSGSTLKVNSPTSSTVTGQITNNQVNSHGATIQATFYDHAGKTLGTAKGNSPVIDPGKTGAFTLTTTADLTSSERMAVTVVSIF